MSGKEVVKILCNHFGFRIINTDGSHYTLLKDSCNPPILLQVYMHSELKHGTLTGIISDAGINREDFLKVV